MIHHQVATGHVVLNGEPVVPPICGVFEIEDGRITAWRQYVDLGPTQAASSATDASSGP